MVFDSLLGNGIVKRRNAKLINMENKVCSSCKSFRIMMNVRDEG